jgi:hypothetical protein
MAIWLRFKAWIIAAAAGLSALLAMYVYGRTQGAAKERLKQSEADMKTARGVEDAADRARLADGDNVDPVERLRKFKRLRDL